MSPFGAGGEFPGGGSGGGGGSVTIPKNLVVGMPSDIHTVEIDGLSGSPDRLPLSPSTFNDEFDENAAGVPSGWTSTAAFFGSLPTCNTNDLLSHLHMVAPTTAVANGIFKAAPTTFPFTVIAKVADAVAYQNNQESGIYVGAQSPGNAGNLFAIGIVGVANAIPVVQNITINSATGVGGVGSTVGTGIPPLYLKIVVTATTITRFYSFGGKVWTNAGAATTGLTIVTPSVGLFVNTSSAAQNAEAMFDWIRFS